jgi:acyl-CoA thioesterase-2
MPDELRALHEFAQDLPEGVPMKLKRFLTEKRPFEFRPVRPINFVERLRLPPATHVWIRAVDELPTNLSLHQNLLAYVSDYELLGASTLPHALSFVADNVILASLDHALWFHRQFRIDEWLLYAIDSPNASGARGYSRGQFFTRDGRLVASTCQEGLVRVVDPADARPRSHPKSQR